MENEKEAMIDIESQIHSLYGNEEKEHKRIPISIIAGKALIFDVNVIKKLRSLGIGGVLSGTLPTAPQQNIFLGIPLQLMVEEVIWLVIKGYAFLIPDEKLINELITNLGDDDVKTIQKDRTDNFNLQKNEKLKQLNNKLDSLNKNTQSTNTKSSLITQSLFIDIKDNSTNLPNYKLLQSIYQQTPQIQQQLLSSLNYNELNYLIFAYLKLKNYFLAPGLRFGGKFIGYPGDPLRYHAHLIINPVEWDQDIGLMNIVNGGRLATGVKKVWLIGSKPEKEESDNSTTEKKEEEEEQREKDIKGDGQVEDDVVCFSFEWAGFG